MGADRIAEKNYYILKFYKRIIRSVNEKDPVIEPRTFNFMAWYTFDGIDIIPIDSFENIQKQSLLTNHNDETKSKILYLERQKLPIFCLHKNINNDKSNYGNASAGELFSHGKYSENKINGLPVIVVTIIGFDSLTDIFGGGQKISETVNDYIKRKKSNKYIKYHIFGTLLPNSIVAVFRSNSYGKIIEFLTDLQNISPLTDKNMKITNTYSTLGLDPHEMNYKNWKESGGITASIKFIAKFTEDFKKDSLIKTLSKEKIFYPAPKEIYVVPGRYDYTVTGKINDCRKLAKLYIDNKFKDNHNLLLYNTSLHIKSNYTNRKITKKERRANKK